MNNECIDCNGPTVTEFGDEFAEGQVEQGVIYVRRGKENVEICLSCWQKTRGIK